MVAGLGECVIRTRRRNVESPFREGISLRFAYRNQPRLLATGLPYALQSCNPSSFSGMPTSSSDVLDIQLASKRRSRYCDTTRIQQEYVFEHAAVGNDSSVLCPKGKRFGDRLPASVTLVPQPRPEHPQPRTVPLKSRFHARMSPDIVVWPLACLQVAISQSQSHQPGQPKRRRT
jgi:hypothetical protein